LFIAVLVALNFPLHQHVTIIVPLLLGPVVGAASLSWEATVALGVAALGGSFVAALPAGIIGHPQEIVAQSTIVISGVVLAIGAWQRERAASASTRVSHVASKSQAALMPTVRHSLPGVSLATRYRSASDESLIGGDFFEVVHSLYGDRIIVGDVSGRGVEAMGLAAAVRRAFIEAAATEPDLREVARILDRTVQEREDSSEEEFATALLVTLPVGAGEGLHIVNCGHHEPICMRDGTCTRLTPSRRALPLGFDGDRVEFHYTFDVGDRVLCFTDGIVEARNASGEYFPLEEAFCAVSTGETLDGSLGRLLVEMTRHTGGLVGDDIALLVFERRDERVAVPNR
jgi:serine phosphatase RsbU (regulator of sigma subunit)